MEKLISISQIKKFMKSKSQWAWEYILWIKDEFKNDSFDIWKALHKYIETKDIELAKKEMENVEDKEKALETFEILLKNLAEFDLPKWEHEVKVDFDIWGWQAIWFVDLLTDDCVYDFKTVSSLSKPDDKPAMWQVVNNYEEYKLQMYFYMYATGKKKAKILEIMKKEFKTKSVPWQWIEFEMTDELANDMFNKYQPIVSEMLTILNQHKIFLQSK